MDFFSAAQDAALAAAPTDADDVASFAHAIAARYASAPSPPIALPASLSPTPPAPRPVRLPSSPMANMSLAPRKLQPSAAIPHPFIAVPPSALSAYLADPSTLIVDIRPHAAYSSARIPRALSLSVPSTLLKRPLFSLHRLAAMLPSSSARMRFAAWHSATRILVYDADAASIPDSSNIHGLLRKFKNDGFDGDLAWLQGGFQSVWRDRRDLVDTDPPTPDTEQDDDDDRPILATPTPSSVLRTKHLPLSAFSLSSTTASTTAAAVPKRPNHSIPLSTSKPLRMSMPPLESRPAFNPFFDTIRQNVELSHGITERIPLRLPRRVRRRIADLPFPWLREIAMRADRSPLTYHRPPHYHYHHHRPHLNPSLDHHPAPPSSSSSSSEDTSEDSDTSPDPADIEEGTEALAMQFYRIELAEQRRLMGVMQHHSKESGRFVEEGLTQASLTFPFSITAGVEKGAKNRYRHIWPFEHARVRLHRQKRTEGDDDDGDDYVNASYVQPIGTTRRYIATQGPLPATFNDFWRLCWEQNVHVIVMLTREVEGSMVKCGSYWVDNDDNDADGGSEKTYGPLRLKLVGKIGYPGGVDLLDGRGQVQAQAVQQEVGSFFESAAPQPPAPLLHHQNQYQTLPQPSAFSPTSSSSYLSARAHQHHHRHRPITTIKRTFELVHEKYKHVSARRIVHLQYLEWPDMNVPEDARGVLELIREVERGVEETRNLGGNEGAESVGPEQADETRHAGMEMEIDEGSGIAKHALGGREKRPVLLHCSAGVGRTGGFIAIDAVLDAVRREIKNAAEASGGEAEMEKGKGKQVDATSRNQAGSREDGDAMDVDEDVDAGSGLGTLVTVPIPVSAGSGGGRGLSLSLSGESGGKVTRADMETGVGTMVRATEKALGHEWPGEDTRDGGGLVVHVPAVVLPGPRGSDEMRTPMQIDGDGVGTRGVSGVATRKWAEDVLDETGTGGSTGTTNAAATLEKNADVVAHDPHQMHLNHHHHIHPPPSSISVSSSSSISAPFSAFPSMSDSDDSYRRKDMRRERWGGQSSSLGTSVSGASDGEGMGKPMWPLRLPVFGERKEIERKNETENGNEKRLERRLDAEGPQQQRTRTFSAPSAALGLEHGQLRHGVGSSPLAASVMAGKRPKVAEETKQVQRQSVAGITIEGEPPSKSMPPSANELAADAQALPSLPRPIPPHQRQQHPLSKSSPPLHASAPLTISSSPPASFSQYTPDKLVSSSFQARTTTVDYKEPRRLHADAHASVTALSTYEEPIWEVVQDMREQRMSLCQSLRQYVFVHAAIIEGALMIVDEEREGRVGAENGGGGGSRKGTTSVPPVSDVGPPTVRPALPMYTTPSDGSMTSSSTGKRGASPTELLKEGKKGEVLLSKRPSIKRKHAGGNSDAAGRNATFQSQSQSQSGSGSPAGPTGGGGLHLQLKTVPPSPPLL